ncbi:MAG TPA: zinc-finger domain-containing protein [Alphaproteobacteria bacterium]|nr:zinc-finger domain-containing protein [Alphaproteobacteria bacterium]
MDPIETILVDDYTVACDGGEGPLGHPMVHLKVGPVSGIDCPYCGRRYVLRDDSSTDG